MMVRLGMSAQKWRPLRGFERQLAEQGGGSHFLFAQWERASKDSWGASIKDLCDVAFDLPGALVPGETGDFLPLDKEGVDVVPYRVAVSHGVARARKAQASSHALYHAVSLGRDTTAHRPEGLLVYTRFHVRDHPRWLDAVIAGVRVAHPEDRRFVFVNGWNAWNEGLFLEPNRQGGFCRVN